MLSYKNGTGNYTTVRDFPGMISGTFKGLYNKSDTNDNTFVSELLTPTPGIWSANGSEEYLKSETTGCFEIPI